MADRNRARAFDATGLKCHSLVVIGPSDKYRGGQRLWECLCVCGSTTFQDVFRLRYGKVKSCGCKTKEILSEARTIHGETDTPTWCSWKSMLDRCYHRDHKSFAAYGGRGIAVCDEWTEYVNFRRDMGERPSGMSLGRIDNSGHYERGNCRWETPKQQARNRRDSRLLSHNGITATISEWAERTGLTFGTLWRRIKNGWPVGKALTTPAKAQKNSRCTFLKTRMGRARVAQYRLA